MAIIDYPAWLPLAQKVSKPRTRDTPYQTSKPAVGPVIFQPITDDLKTSWDVTWIMTVDQDRAFNQWLRSPNYLNNGNNWFRMPINLGGSGLQMQTLHFDEGGYPVHTQNGNVVTWTGTVISNGLFNSDDPYDDIIVELPPGWWSWLDIIVTETLPKVP
ncbi:hypothetical protein [Serratia fonticola]|uniref:hypothetical protein n=1 Tax=Serratia fonticola TaxID=47917 RepID=UPI003AAFF621